MANEFVVKHGLISKNNVYVTGSITATDGITGSLYGTSSWAYYVVNGSIITGAFYYITSSWSENSLTASYITASNIDGTVLSSSYALSASYVPSVEIDLSALLSASTFNNWTGSNSSQFSGTSSYANTSSYLTVGTYPITASYAVNAISASYLSGSRGIVNNFTSNNGIEVGGVSNGNQSPSIVQLGFGLSTANNILNAVQIGYQVGVNSTTAINAIQIGNLAGYSSTNASDAVQIGYAAGSNATNAAYSTQIGYSAGLNATTATYAVQIGYEAGRDSTDAYLATQIGYQAGKLSTNADFATQIGYQAGEISKTASNATQIGYQAGQFSTNADSATQIGYGAGNNSTNASGAVQIGYYAGFNSSNATNAVHIGNLAGFNAKSGSYTTFIGYGADTLHTSLNVQKSIAIGYNAKVSGSNMAVIGGTGVDAINVGIGITDPSYNLQVNGTIAPVGDGIYPLGNPVNRFSDLFALQSTIGAFFEVGLRTENIGKNPTGTVVSWKNGKLIPCEIEEDELVMGVLKEGKDEPIILGAETVLVTGKVEEGDYIVTSNKRGHGKAVKRGMLFKKDLFGKVIAQALETSNENSKLIKAMIRKM